VESKDQNRVYLPGLNALRFFAAFLVIIAHVELLKGHVGYVDNIAIMERFNLGGLGVYFFFVLSGFLITFLLIHEKDKTGSINIKAFYIRRLLRIWPLYYLITFLAFFILPNIEFLHVTWLQQFFEENYSLNLLFFILMLPNLALAMFSAVPHAGHLWSIGVEEQFYLLWPVLFNKAKNLKKLLFLVLGFILGLKVLVIVLLKFGIVDLSENFIVFKEFLAMSKFECMAIGGFGAYWVKMDVKSVLNIIYHPVSFIMSLALLPFMNYFCPESLQDAIHLPYSVAFVIIILNISCNSKSIIKLENRIFNFLGKISYGIYMYHMIVVVFVIRLSMKFIDEGSILANLFIYGFSVLLTIFIAWLSYEYFEKRFLKLKDKYTIVKSGKI